jgi:hypothetical protein
MESSDMGDPRKRAKNKTPIDARHALVLAQAAVAHLRDGATPSNAAVTSSAPDRAPQSPRRPRLRRPLLTLLRFVLIAGAYCYIMANLIAVIVRSKKTTMTTDGSTVGRGPS